MAYQIRRSNRVVEDLELCDSNGKVVDTIRVDLDIDSISGRFRAQYAKLISAERQITAVRKNSVNAENAQQIFETYGTALINLLDSIFGVEDTQKILVFYENNYIEMSIQIFPFVHEVIIPQIEKSVNQSKEQLKQRYINRRNPLLFGKK